LLALMGSKIQVESVYGKGSRFYFSLEQQIVDSTPVGDLEERIQKQATEYEYVAAFTASDAQILVVDDNLTNLKVFVSLLKRTKVNVDVADRGKTCLEMVADKHYDLIFLDHMMPEMDGIETLHCLKEMDTNLSQDAPVVALTANAITGAKEMYLAEGFDAFLSKPINPEKLEQMILRLLPRDLLQFDVEPDEAMSEVVHKRKPVSDTELPIIEGVDWNYGMLHFPEESMLLETVEDFYKAINIEADALERFYQECKDSPDMLKQYKIKVHSMKSTANLIGIVVLGGMAKILENAAKDGDVARIDALHPIFIEEWRSYREKLEEIIKTEEKEGVLEASSLQPEEIEIILTCLEQLRDAFEETDIDTMDEIMETLNGYQYSAELAERMEKLSVYVIHLEEEQANAEITAIKDSLHQWLS